jgi:putative membrane protein
MTTTQGDLAALSRFIFRAPTWYASLGMALALAAITGIGAFDSRFVLEDAWQGLFYIGIPTVVASAFTAAVDRHFGGQLTPNRATLLALACEVVVIAAITVAGIVAVFTRLGQNFVFDVLFMALASIFAFRLLVIMAVSRHSLPVAAIPASVQTVAAAVLLFVYSGTARFLSPEIETPLVAAYLSRPEKAPAALLHVGPEDFLHLAVLCGVYALGVWVFLVVIDRPWRTSLGVSALDFIQGFIGYIAEGSTELEDFFEQLGEEAVVPVTVLSFRAGGGDASPDERAGHAREHIGGGEKARFVLPMIHPGPLGEIGGGNLPQRVAATAEGLAFPAHATAGHDFNLVTERELDTVIETIERAADRIEYEAVAAPGIRVESGETKMLAQAFGDGLLAVATYSPGFTDDVMFGVGMSAMAEARAGGFEDVLLVDAHSCNDGIENVEDIGHVYHGSERAFDLMEATQEASDRLADAPRHPLRLGTAWEKTDWTPEDGIGPQGIRVAVTEVDGRTAAYVLVDGNNMEPGLRDRIVAELDAVDHAEVMTTDNHVVNRVKSQNQVGAAIDQDDLVECVRALTDEAIEDLEPVEVGMATERAHVTVFGSDRTETLASHANAMLSMGGALAGAVILAALAVSLLIFFLA